jgi:hypothetical protein
MGCKSLHRESSASEDLTNATSRKGRLLSAGHGAAGFASSPSAASRYAQGRGQTSKRTNDHEHRREPCRVRTHNRRGERCAPERQNQAQALDACPAVARFALGRVACLHENQGVRRGRHRTAAERTRTNGRSGRRGSALGGIARPAPPSASGDGPGSVFGISRPTVGRPQSSTRVAPAPPGSGERASSVGRPRRADRAAWPERGPWSRLGVWVGRAPVSDRCLPRSKCAYPGSSAVRFFWG